MKLVQHLLLSTAVLAGGLAEAMTGVVATYTRDVFGVNDQQEMNASINQMSEVLASYEHELALLRARTVEFGGLIGNPVGLSVSEPVGGMDQEINPSVPGLAERLVDLDQQMQSLERRSARLSVQEGQIVSRVANAIRGFPVEQGFISSPFGVRKDPFGYKMMQHKGVDIAADPGAQVFATAPGEVYAAAWMEGFGNAVIINHEPGGLQTIYAHLGEIDVSRGMKVERGDVLGSVGSSGRSTGPHIHYEIRLADNSIDPLPFLYR